MFPHQELSPETAKNYLVAWYEIGCQVGEQNFDRALRCAVYGSKFFPTVSEIRDSAGLNEEHAAMSEGEQAWLVVLEYLRKYGSEGMPVCRYEKRGDLLYELPPEKPPRLTDRIEYAVRQAGGLKVICATQIEDQHFRRDDFIKAYESYDYSERYPLQLPDSLRPLLASAIKSARMPALPRGDQSKPVDPHQARNDALTDEDRKRAKEAWDKVEAAAATPPSMRHRQVDMTEPSDEEKLRRRDEMLAALKAKGKL